MKSNYSNGTTTGTLTVFYDFSGFASDCTCGAVEELPYISGLKSGYIDSWPKPGPPRPHWIRPQLDIFNSFCFFRPRDKLPSLVPRRDFGVDWSRQR